MRYLKLAILIVVLVFLITFGTQNSQSVHVRYYFNTINGDIPLYAVIYISTAIGILLGYLIGSIKRRRLRKTVKRYEKERVASQAENARQEEKLEAV